LYFVPFITFVLSICPEMHLLIRFLVYNFCFYQFCPEMPPLIRFLVSGKKKKKKLAEIIATLACPKG
jgi:hypothetical protein